MIEENIVLGAGSEYPLDGKLTLPDAAGTSVPAVVLVHGSGPSNMDAKVGNNCLFKELAHGLSAQGIAALRYDKRTFVHGKKMKNNTAITVKDETIEDAVLAAELLRQDNRIDSKRIFIIGHSMGGMLAPRIDAEGGSFAGIIVMAGSPRTLEQIMMGQNDDVLHSLNKLLQFIAKKQIASLSAKLSNIYSLSDEEAKATKILGKYTRAYYFKEMGEHPASQYLHDLHKPILIMQGDKDFHVSVERDFNGYKALLGDKPNATFKLYPGLNHLFMPYVYDQILKAKQEYKRPQHVDQQVIQDIATWIHSCLPDKLD